MIFLRYSDYTRVKEFYKFYPLHKFVVFEGGRGRGGCIIIWLDLDAMKKARNELDGARRLPLVYFCFIFVHNLTVTLCLAWIRDFKFVDSKITHHPYCSPSTQFKDTHSKKYSQIKLQRLRKVWSWTFG